MKILIISHIYPSLDHIEQNRNSFFLHMYVKQWRDMGHEVRVEHMALNYPRLFNFLCYRIKSWNNHQIPWCNYRQNEYGIDGIKVNRIPLMKIVPHGTYSKRTLNRMGKEILNDLKSHRFEPDIIISDYLNPGLMVMNDINQSGAAKTYAIIHGADAHFLNSHMKYLKKEKIEKLSGLGFRSKALEKFFSSRISLPKSFLIPSGVPQYYLETKRTPRTEVRNILVVSRLIEQKHIDCIIKAISELNKNKEGYSLTIIGDGELRTKLEKLVYSLSAEGWCDFKGRLERQEVLEQMNKADVFVLLSEMETFGMVYTEAMSQGCITVGSLNEGIDGIIIDGINGFLLPAGDEKGLIRLLQEITCWDGGKIEKISMAAMETAAAMTDENLAAEILKEMS